jgi:hypothetical protein
MGRHRSIRTTEAGVYETDELHGRIMCFNSLGYGNHPLFSAQFHRAFPAEQGEQAFQQGLIREKFY